LAVNNPYNVAYSADKQNVLGGAAKVSTLFGADANCESFMVAQVTPEPTADAPTKLSLGTDN